MCNHDYNAYSNVYFHAVRTEDLCRITFSFGFYKRNDFHNLNPYGLEPYVIEDLYQGPFGQWTFAVNFRIKCEQLYKKIQQRCNQNIQLARDIHNIWHNSHIWKTFPHYAYGGNNQGIDFIATPSETELFILTQQITNLKYREVTNWFVNFTTNNVIGVNIEEVDVLPPNGLNLHAWIISRIAEINGLGPIQNYLGNNGLNPIPTQF